RVLFRSWHPSAPAPAEAHWSIARFQYNLFPDVPAPSSSGTCLSPYRSPHVPDGHFQRPLPSVLSVPSHSLSPLHVRQSRLLPPVYSEVSSYSLLSPDLIWTFIIPSQRPGSSSAQSRLQIRSFRYYCVPLRLPPGSILPPQHKALLRPQKTADTEAPV